MTTATPRRPLSSLLEVPSIREIHAPQWFERLPRWLQIGGPLLVLMVISAFIRSRTLGGQLWFDEGIATGMASHSLSALPGILRQAGAAPLYYVLLHFWIDVFGSSESIVHALSLAFALATIPAGMWAAWSLFGRRAGYYAAVLFAFSSFLTRYGQEAEMYSLLMLLAMFAVAGFLHGFVYGRRRYLIMFVAATELMLYTHGSAFLFLAGAVVAVYPVWRRSTDRRGLLRDAGLSFLAIAILYLPWLPTTLHQLANATSPWHYAPLLGATVPSDLLGGERVDATLAVAAVVGLAPLFLAQGRRTRDWTAMWVLILLAVVGLALARAGQHDRPFLGGALLRLAGHADPAAGHAGRGAGAGGRRRGDRAVRRLLGQRRLVRARVQERHARRRRRDRRRSCTPATWSSAASPSRPRWPSTTCPAACATPPPRGRYQTPPT